MFKNLRTFPNFIQTNQKDCGPYCLKIILKHYDKNYDTDFLRELSKVNNSGTSIQNIKNAAESLGFITWEGKITTQFLRKVNLPCILYWNNNHFVVLYKITKNKKYYISDPASGKYSLNEEEFNKCWTYNNEVEYGVAMSLLPHPNNFKKNSSKENNHSVIKWKRLFEYLYKYKKYFYQIILGLIIGLFFQLIIPFLTQSLVDIGINTKNISFIKIILIAQLAFFLGQISINYIRSMLNLYISSRISVKILNDLVSKIMNLPMGFFETKTTGDIIQRFSDQNRIESFLTGSLVNTLFSFINLTVFSFILAIYSIKVFFIFLLFSLIYLLWITLFLKKRKKLDHKRFAISSSNQSNLMEMIQGIHEIKLNNSENYRIKLWKDIQTKLFKFKIESLGLVQIQQSGSIAINQLKNIIITYICALEVVDGDMTLGSMLAIQYISGNLNSPIEQILNFVQSFQDAKLSIERINEIYNIPDEDSKFKNLKNEIPKIKNITFKNVSYFYTGSKHTTIKNISCRIEENKVTAIVGASGSGKTTLLKLILKYFDPTTGNILVDQKNLNNISYKKWRERCSVVLQDGFIFADTIERNITLGKPRSSEDYLQNIINISNLRDFINEQPLGLKTRIGIGGKGISQGQKQRILIARALYKDPEIIIFDEATSALDSKNETEILKNLKSSMTKKTTIIVAHRLTTIKNVDNIIVIKNGEIVEQGCPDNLLKTRGEFYSLFNSQHQNSK